MNLHEWLHLAVPPNFTSYIYMYTIYLQVSEIRRYLQSQMKMTIVEIRDPDAIVEGGDVLFTGMGY